MDEEAKLLALKADLKAWERGFALEHGRKPSKPDIASRHRIAALYKEYQAAEKRAKEAAIQAKEAQRNEPVVVEASRMEDEGERNETAKDSSSVDEEALFVEPPKRKPKSLSKEFDLFASFYGGFGDSESSSMQDDDHSTETTENNKNFDQHPKGEKITDDFYSSSSSSSSSSYERSTSFNNTIHASQNVEPEAKRPKTLDEPSQTISTTNGTETGEGGFDWGGNSDLIKGKKRENFRKMKISNGPSVSSGTKGRSRSGIPKGSKKGAQRVSSRAQQLEGDSSSSDFSSDPSDVPVFSEPTTLDPLSRTFAPLPLTLTGEEMKRVLKERFGFDEFRDGQEETIRLFASGGSLDGHNRNCLSILPTGTGKSICYQFPASLLEPGKIAIVVSPLLALIKDQMDLLPDSCRPAASLNSSMSRLQIRAVLENLVNGNLKILFVSPEKLQSRSFLSLWDKSAKELCYENDEDEDEEIRSIATKGMPEISFACVDEAHCISQWSHNFRPSYLRIARALTDRLKVKQIIGLTATCSPIAEQEVRKWLRIPEQNVVRRSPVRSNLHLTCSCDTDRHQALLLLLTSSHYQKLKSIIVYCMFQQQTEEVVQFLRAKSIVSIGHYHAGLTPAERKKIQDKFMANEMRIVVATVAFGLGINKSDVGAVVHFSLPSSLENYVQEIGRAGRDGSRAFGHLFLQDEDYVRLRSVAFSDFADRVLIKTLLQKIFNVDAASYASKKIKTNSTTERLVALPVDALTVEIDLKAEVIETILVYLELDENEETGEQWVEVMTPTMTTFNVMFHQTAPQVLAAQNPVIQLLLKHSKPNSKGVYSVDIISLANEQRQTTSSSSSSSSSSLSSRPEKDPSETIERLVRVFEQLQSTQEISFSRTDKSFILNVKRVPTPEQFDQILSRLHAKIDSLSTHRAHQADTVYSIMRRASFPSVRDVLALETQQTDLDSSIQLEPEREIDFQIGHYFRNPEKEDQRVTEKNWPVQFSHSISESSLQYIRADLRQLISRGAERGVKNGRIAARILHGLSSPAFPGDQWYHESTWGRYKNVDFLHLRSLANAEFLAIFARS